MAGSRAAQVNRRVAVDAPVVLGALHERPLLTVALDLNHRNTFAGLSLVHVFGGLRVFAVIEQVAVIGVFVVDRHQCAAGGLRLVAGEGKQAHAVIVVAELQLLHLRSAFAAGVKCRAVGVQGLTPTDQDRGAIAGRQTDAVGGGRGDAVEAKQRAVGGADTGGHHAAAEQVAPEKHRRAAQGARADESASGQANHVFEVGGLVIF